MAIALSWENKVIRYDNNQKFICTCILIKCPTHTKILIWDDFNCKLNKKIYFIIENE